MGGGARPTGWSEILRRGCLVLCTAATTGFGAAALGAQTAPPAAFLAMLAVAPATAIAATAATPTSSSTVDLLKTLFTRISFCLRGWPAIEHAELVGRVAIRPGGSPLTGQRSPIRAHTSRYL